MRDPLRLLEEIPNKALSLLGIVVDVDLKSEEGGEYVEIQVDPCPNPSATRVNTTTAAAAPSRCCGVRR